MGCLPEIRSSVDRRLPGRLAGPPSLVGSSGGPGRVLSCSHRGWRHAALAEPMAGDRLLAVSGMSDIDQGSRCGRARSDYTSRTWPIDMDLNGES